MPRSIRASRLQFIVRAVILVSVYNRLTIRVIYPVRFVSVFNDVRKWHASILLKRTRRLYVRLKKIQRPLNHLFDTNDTRHRDSPARTIHNARMWFVCPRYTVDLSIVQIFNSKTYTTLREILTFAHNVGNFKTKFTIFVRINWIHALRRPSRSKRCPVECLLLLFRIRLVHCTRRRKNNFVQSVSRRNLPFQLCFQLKKTKS